MENLTGSFQTALSQTPALAMAIALAAGVLTSLTPCVYPLIPLLVCYVGSKREDTSRIKGFLLSLFYVLGMATTYSILGAIAGLTGSVFGQIQNSFWANLIVGNICLFFALSMMELFFVQIPFFSHFQPKATGKGLLGAFIFGLASGLVASPCAAPVLVVILTLVAAKQSIVYGSLLLFSFAFGMGLLLLLIGTGIGVLSSLPKSGNWMVTIKKVFGLIMLAVAEYYLIQAGKYF